jgi:hypothetical protein
MATGTIRTLLAGAVMGGAVVMAAWWVDNQPPRPTHREIILAYQQGRVDALKLNPVSWDLEQACVGLWAGRLPVDTQK